MKNLSIPIFVVAMVLLSFGCATPKGASSDGKRQYVMNMHDQTLDKLYAAEPIAREKISRAAGHGVFSNIGTNLILVTTEGGYGVVIDKSGNKTYMRMAGGGLGIGLGAKDTRLVFIFNTQWALDEFVMGKWAVGADADAAAKVGDQGGELSATAKTGGVEIYTITENGLALSATISGTRFYRDGNLNQLSSTPQTAKADVGEYGK